MIRTATFAAFLTLLALAILQPIPVATATIYHHDSRPADAGYHEVFLITQATGHIPHDELRILIDGNAHQADWTGGPTLQTGDTFAFDLISYDQTRNLELWHHETRISHLNFGGGAGTPIPP